MKRVYIFSVGGTGVRVMKSLVMLMAAGELEDYEVIPLLIDFDFNNGNVAECIHLINLYKRIQDMRTPWDQCTPTGNIFRSPITSVSNIGNNGENMQSDTYFMDLLSGDCNRRIRDMIGYYSLCEKNITICQLLESLFDENELNRDLCIGFRGNAKLAHLGYILSKIQNTVEFKDFLSNVVPNHDKVIIVGSTFGSTGSAGILEILKCLKDCPNFPIDSLDIATVLVDPYFVPTVPPIESVSRENETIEYNIVFEKRSQEFYDYYNDMNSSNVVNLTCKIGMGRHGINERNLDVFEFTEGGHRQKNPAHTIELLSAMAICEYATNRHLSLIECYLDSDFMCSANLRIGAKEFSRFPNGQRMLESLSQFALGAKFLVEHFSQLAHAHGHYPLYRDLQGRGFSIDRYPFDALKRISSCWLDWIRELSTSSHYYALTLFNVDAPMVNLLREYYYHNGIFHVFHNILKDYEDSMMMSYQTIAQQDILENPTTVDIVINCLSEASKKIYQKCKPIQS